MSGDKPLCEYSEADIEAYVKAMRLMPSDMRYGRLGQSGYMALPYDPVKLPRVTAENQRDERSINRDLSTLHSMSAQLAKQQWRSRFGKNVIEMDFKEHMIAIEDDPGDPKRMPWTPEHLRVMFGLPLWNGSGGALARLKTGTGLQIYQDAAYWVPLLAIYTGMSREEICGLEVIDFFFDCEVPFLLVRANMTRSQDGVTPGGLKRKSRHRVMPIHPELLRLGIEDYVERIAAVAGFCGPEQIIPIFPELYRDDAKRESALPKGELVAPEVGGKRFYKRAWMGIVDAIHALMPLPETRGGKKADFHSTRTYTQSMLASPEVSQTLIDRIMGHAAKGTGPRKYNRRALAVGEVQALKELLALLVKEMPVVTENIQRAPTVSGERPVTLFASEQYQAIIVSLMARAACRALTVDIRNPISGTYSATHSMRDEPEEAPPFLEAAHVISVPPLGVRVSDGQAKGMSFEAYQIEKLHRRATRSFNTIVADGLLFRESRYETDLRQRLVEGCSTTVMSLPSGMFWPTSGLAINLLQVKMPASGSTRLISARTMEITGSGRMPEALIVRHLEQFHGVRSDDTDKSVVMKSDEMAAANYVLLPDRYLKSEELAQIEDAIQELPQISLEQIALIERSKAPTPLRDADGKAEINALEIAPSDVVDGIVRSPKKRQAFAKNQESAVARVTVQHGDILVSIKGNVGIIGIVGLDAFLSEALDEPWIISQSLAIIRWQPNPHIPSPEVLNAVLTAPWVREKLESMSGGGTVRTLPMSAVRSFRLPVPSAEDCAVAASELELLGAMRQDIETLTQNLAQAKNALWHKLWHLPPAIGED